MELAKIKVGQTYNYRTPRGNTGRAKVMTIDTKRPDGAMIVLQEKGREKPLNLRAAMLSK